MTFKAFEKLYKVSVVKDVFFKKKKDIFYFVLAIVLFGYGVDGVASQSPTVQRRYHF